MKSESQKKAEAEAEVAAFQAEQRKKLAATPEWMSKKQPELKTDVSKAHLINYLKSSGQKYEETESGAKIKIAENKDMYVDCEKGIIQLPDHSEGSIKKCAELCSKMGMHTMDLNTLSKELTNDPDKEKILKTFYDAFKNEGIKVTGIEDTLVKKFESNTVQIEAPHS